MSTMTEAKFDQDGFRTFLDGRDEPGWLSDQRQSHWNQFQSLAWPSLRDEEWMRTDLRMFKLDQYRLPIDAGSDAAIGTLLSDGVSLGGQVEVVDSVVRREQLDPALASKGVLFGSLERMAREHPELVRDHLFTRAVNPLYDRFAALHAACWSGGQVVYVPRNVTVDRPLHIGSLLSEAGTDTGHTLIILEEGAEASVLFESSSVQRNGSGFHCGAVEIIQRPGSHLRYVNVQDWGHKTYHFAHQRAMVDRGASIQWTVVALGSQLAKVNQHVALVGRGAESQVNGVLFTEGRQHLAYHTLQHHVAPQCHSDFLYKAALQDRSRTVWRGMIKVDQNAQKTDGYQRNDNLLLSTNARADSIPGLEIEADDVRCTHGSTTSKVDEELIFYACCRGYSRKEAVRLIVSGFFQQIFDRITIESVRDALGTAIGRRVREYA
jgi:Fe-S cluster assembly protein SufD